MGLIFVVFYFGIIVVVLEISVALLRLSGLKKPIARFQALSMMTGTGFTTKESELILRHPIRRRIGIGLILFGALSLAVLISSFSTILAESFRILPLGLALAILGILLLFVRSPFFARRAERYFIHELEEEFELHELPIQEVLYSTPEDLFTSVAIYEDSSYCGKRVGELFGEDEDILLLFIQRGEVRLRCKLGQETIEAGDVLYLYGDKGVIERDFKRELKEMHEKVVDEMKAASLED
ncbi:TrkA C-terminal domain-containing protein [Gorillibacterium sp. sgz500922]|uniref:TrkA C-terminal domain-containing protein n=1 Tax=Gorillibacterium sp. sgz500922 TaxID=3446694 RepID=UPI003F661873